MFVVGKDIIKQDKARQKAKALKTTTVSMQMCVSIISLPSSSRVVECCNERTFEYVALWREEIIVKTTLSRLQQMLNGEEGRRALLPDYAIAN